MVITNEQSYWQALCKKYGDMEAKAMLARRLREAADIVEADGYPDVFSADIPDNTKTLKEQGIITRISLILSYPWPG